MYELKIIKIEYLFLYIFLIQVKGCYWNDKNPYRLFGSKTPYDTVRGDIRDYETPENCKAVSIWNINRHGNKNPGSNVTMCMRDMAALKDEIIESYEAGSSELCAQKDKHQQINYRVLCTLISSLCVRLVSVLGDLYDRLPASPHSEQDIENLKKWSWNSTLDVSQAYLTGPGYEESYDIGKRIRAKYRHLFEGSPDEFHLRPTYEQRSVVSCVAYVHGLTDGISLNVTMEEPWAHDNVIGPSENCDFYKKKIRYGKTVIEKLRGYFKSAKYEAVRNAVQKRLGIKTELNVDNVFCIYNLCRYYSSWNPTRQSPWCAAFTKEDLKVLEYYDDVIHYYKNGYGSWVNVNLGKTALKDMYESFEAAVNGTGKKLTAYFTHNTMMGMVFAAIGLNKGDEPLQSDVISANRKWRTSFSAAFSSNIIAVLNRCNDNRSLETYRVQLFINEKETDICPLQGCTWQEFQDKFQIYKSLNLNFCSLENMHEMIELTP